MAEQESLQQKQQVIAFLKNILANGMKLEAERIEPFVPFENYGIDSFLTMKLTDEMEQHFGSLSKTLFFEYRNLDELASYFCAHHTAKLQQIGVLGQAVETEAKGTSSAVQSAHSILDGMPSYQTVACVNGVQTEAGRKEVPQPQCAAAETQDDIAIIGLAGKYPKAEDIEAFWQNISGGMDCITVIPKERWDHALYYDADKSKKDRVYSQWGGFLDGVDAFDPMFFHISPKEAKEIDPQERLFLECAYHAMEDAGYTKDNLTEQAEGNLGCKVGVFVGVMFEDYQYFGIEQQMQGNLKALSGVAASVANRVSYTFNFNGPSMVVETQCSSSLTAIHLACQSLKSGECQAAVVGGVNLCLHPNKYLLLSQGKFLSSQGKCQSFGEGGDGYVPSEGVGAAILKPLAKAIADHDHIYGVIKGSAVNHGGKTNGYTVPNPVAQGELLRTVYAHSGISPRSISYLEAHGTGTALGDPIEMTGLCRAFEQASSDRGYCEIGSVKSNIGHCESAAGIASLTKVLMQMKYQKIAPSIHSKVLNPLIDFQNTPFHVPQELMEWKHPVVYENGSYTAYPLRAGISSFGAGGSNAHIIVEEYRADAARVKPNTDAACLILSARSKNALVQKAEALAAFAKTHPDTDLADIAYVLSTGREQFDYRLAFEAHSVAEMENILRRFAAGNTADPAFYYVEKSQRRMLSEHETDGSVISGWIADKQYHRLAELWVNGCEIPFLQCFEGLACYKLSLPLYPFEQGHYWFDASRAEMVQQKAEQPETTKTVSPTVVSVQSRKEILQQLSGLIESILQIPQKELDHEEAFTDLGFDSLSIVEFTTAIGEMYHLSLTPDIIYNYQNLKSLSQYLAEQGVSVSSEPIAPSIPDTLEAAPQEKVISQECDKELSAVVVGMAGRFPDAENVEALWQILQDGKDVIRTVPRQRNTWNAVYEGLSDAECQKYRIGVMPNADAFDAAFFDILPVEAESIDPRQRILLEEMWHALEDAGFGKADLEQEQIGIFVGAEESEYRKTLSKEVGILSNHNAVLAARLAYHLNLHGPNFTLNTACSSGLVALHMARESILRGECDAAIVAGVNLLPIPDAFVAMQNAGMLSPDCVCSPFGKKANGMVAAEAAAVVILERAEAAKCRGHHIYGTIMGSGINYDGKTNGLTAPSGQAQMQLLEHVYDRYGIDVGKIGYMLAHGTGTKLGDPIEVNALTAVWNGRKAKPSDCALGSVKGNLGHTQAASGLVSLIAMLQAMKHECIPASIHCEERNEYINWKDSPFYVPQQNTEWKKTADDKRYGAISAFGVSGTNAHIVVCQDTALQEAAEFVTSPQLYVFSAKSKEALIQKCRDTAAFLMQHPDISPNQIAATLLKGRVHFGIRCAFAADRPEQAAECLNLFADAYEKDGAFAGNCGTCHVYSNVIPKNFEPEQDTAEQMRKQLQTLKQQKNDNACLEAAAQDFCQGYEMMLAEELDMADAEMISMTGYPFRRTSYWGDAEQAVHPKSTDNGYFLHPLLHRNISTFAEQAFQSDFQGTEAFFAHHEIDGKKTLPGVAYLEIAYQALKHSAAHDGTWVLKNVGWLKPMQISAEDGCQMKVTVGMNARNELAFTIESQKQNAAWDVNCCGYAQQETKQQPVVDLQTYQQMQGTAWTGAQCYALFTRRQMQYGSSFRTLQQVIRKDTVAVAELKSEHQPDNAYAMFYGILDGALQATAVFADEQEHSAAMPYALERLDIYAPLEMHMWAVIRQNSKARVQLYSIDLCNAEGKVAVHLENYAAAVLSEQVQSVEAVPEKEESQPSAEQDAEAEQQTAQYLAGLIAKGLKLPVSQVQPSTTFEMLAIDSLMMLHLTEELENVFGALPKTLFFEYNSPLEMSRYFLEMYPDILSGVLPQKQAAVRLPKRSDANVSFGVKNAIQIPTISKQHYRNPVSHLQEDIAIIGIAGRYPQADTLEEFFDNLCEGMDCITEIPENRWNNQPYFSSNRKEKGKIHCKWGGFLRDVDAFDPLFFHISPREAEIIDPQERLFLECVYQTIADAGYTGATLCAAEDGDAGSPVGVFVGTMMSEYQLYGAQEQSKGNMTAVNGINASIANRVSYYFNFSGPSMSLDTQCSSSLTAIHLACQSIQNGDCQMAIAGGVNITIHPNKYLLLSNGNFMASNGRCMSFGEGGDGYVPGEGVGSILLKPLSQAIEAHDHIYAVIKGSAVNHGGKTSGYTVPNPRAQSRVIEKAIQAAGISPHQMTYLEAHGTGTSLGDPIEVEGMTKAFRKYTDDTQFCAIGSVKSNIGHCEGAAGMAAISKVLLQMQHHMLVPSIHSETLNPFISFDDTPFFVQHELTEWKRQQITENGIAKEYPLTAGISSFGAGGSNAHIILSEYIAPEEAVKAERTLIFVFSAKSLSQLHEFAQQLLHAAERTQYTQNQLEAVSYTLAVGREAMEYRAGFAASNATEYITALRGYCNRLPGQITVWESKTGERTDLQQLLEYDDLQDMMHKMAAQGKYQKLIRLWTLGYDVNWSDLLDIMQIAPQRISLPGYPFAKQRCWLTQSANAVTVMPMQNEKPAATESTEEAPQPMELAEICWVSDECENAETGTFAKNICICIGSEAMAEKVRREADAFSVQQIPVLAEQTAEEAYVNAAVSLFEAVKSVLQQHLTGKTGMVVLADTQQGTYAWYGLSGLLRTAAIENPNLVCTLAECDDWQRYSVKELLHCHASAVHIRFVDGKRLVPQYELAAALSEKNAFRNGGVYLISGGAGGLGRIFAEEIVRKTVGAAVILTGRSAENDSVRQFMESLRQHSAKVEYVSLDVTDAEQVKNTIAQIRAKYGSLHGVIHAAGIHKDHYILTKTAEEFRKVLLPKVCGTAALDAATQTDALDFFVCFSSVSGCFGNAGQADYAAANAFMDGWMLERSRLVQEGKRSGKSLSINWPLWKHGGMQVDAQTERMLEKASGLAMLSTAAGIRAFSAALQENGSNYICLAGNRTLYGKLIGKHFEADAECISDTETIRTELSAEEKDKLLADYLAEILSEAIKLPPNQIDADVMLEEYGIDSVMSMEMKDELEKVFGTLPVTLFYEFKTLRAVQKHLESVYPDKVMLILQQNGRTVPQNDVLKPSAAEKAAFVPVPEQTLQMETEASSIPQNQQQVAIVGLAGVYPKAENLETLWENLLQGMDCVTTIPKARWDNALYYEADRSIPETIHGNWGGFIEGADEFDASFFKIAPRDAAYMDPQERKFIECVYHALEDAGYRRDNLAGKQREDLGSRVGVFVGSVNNEYQLLGIDEQHRQHLVAMNEGIAAIANRVSYLFNFSGPSMAVDSQCSSSLTALYLAYHSIVNGECEAAVAGGVNLLLHPNRYLMLSGGNFLSSQGECAAFGADGDGYVPGEGVGALILKPLERAVAEHDHIYAVIRGIAVNHGGKTNGFTVPNPNAQSELIARTLRQYEIDPRTISYVEAHGTGTKLGDPIEIAGLTQAYRQFTNDVQYCSIGSVKSNIGHCEGAAGIASVTKVLLQMQHHTLVPTIHTEPLNPFIDFAATPFRVQTHTEEWKRQEIQQGNSTVELPLRAAVSGFGAGGSNVHLILEEYHDASVRKMEAEAQNDLFLLSACSPEQLVQSAKQLAEQIAEEGSSFSMKSASYTLLLGREPQEYRLGILADTPQHLQRKLERFAEQCKADADVYYSKILSNAERRKQPQMQCDLQACWNAQKYDEILQYWVKGYPLDFDMLHLEAETDWKRMHLPLYPFMKEKIWLPKQKNAQRKKTEETAQNRSFAYSLTEKQQFVYGHLDMEPPIPAETGYLGLLCDAVGKMQDAETAFSLEHIRWQRPLLPQHGGCQLVAAVEHGKCSMYAETKNVQNLICEGTWNLNVSYPESPISWKQAAAQCRRELDVNACYRLLAEMGLHYGAAFRTLQRIYFDENICAVHLKANTVSEPQTADAFAEMLTGAMQACCVFGIDGQNLMQRPPKMPFTPDCLMLFGKCGMEMDAVIQRTECGNQRTRYEIALYGTDNRLKLIMFQTI